MRSAVIPLVEERDTHAYNENETHIMHRNQEKLSLAFVSGAMVRGRII